MIKIPILKNGNTLLNKKLKEIKTFKFIDNTKTIVSVFLFILSISIYGYFINISSTKGFFIKQENDKLSEIKFQKEIIQIDIEKYKSNLFNTIMIENLDSYNINRKIIVINDLIQITKHH